jgi:hypothetical protein
MVKNIPTKIEKDYELELFNLFTFKSVPYLYLDVKKVNKNF